MWLVPTLNDAHEYSFDGVRVPGVTEILKAAGVIDDRWFNEQARERGTLVHKACALLIQCRLDRSSVDERLQGYLDSFEKFLDKTGFVAQMVEKPGYHPAHKYCGTLDLFGGIAGNHILDVMVLDIKSGVKAKWHGLQTAAYAMFFDEREFRKIKRGTLYLDKDGKVAKFDLHTDRDEFDRFLQFRREFHGSIDRPN